MPTKAMPTPIRLSLPSMSEQRKFSNCKTWSELPNIKALHHISGRSGKVFSERPHLSKAVIG